MHSAITAAWRSVAAVGEAAARRRGRPYPKQLKNKAKTPIFMVKWIAYATRPHDGERKQLRF